MSSSEIAENIFREGRYKALCKSIAKNPLSAEELYSEFLKSILEVKDDRLNEARQGGYLDVFCVGVVHNLWGKRLRVNKGYAIGSTSPLFQASGIEVDETNFIQEDYSAEADELATEAQELIKKEMYSEDKTTMYKSRVFYYSHIQYKNPKKFSEHSGIPYSAVIKTCHKYRERLKQLFKDKIND